MRIVFIVVEYIAGDVPKSPIIKSYFSETKDRLFHLIFHCDEIIRKTDRGDFQIPQRNRDFFGNQSRIGEIAGAWAVARRLTFLEREPVIREASSFFMAAN